MLIYMTLNGHPAIPSVNNDLKGSAVIAVISFLVVMEAERKELEELDRVIGVIETEIATYSNK